MTYLSSFFLLKWLDSDVTHIFDDVTRIYDLSLGTVIVVNLPEPGEELTRGGDGDTLALLLWRLGALLPGEEASLLNGIHVVKTLEDLVENPCKEKKLQIWSKLRQVTQVPIIIWKYLIIQPLLEVKY